MALARRLVSAVTAMALIATQSLALAQDAQQAAGAAGQEFGRAAVPDPAALFSSGGASVTVFPGSASSIDIPLEQLFPGASGPTVPDLRSLFRDEHAANEAGAGRTSELGEEASAEGEAYRLVLDSREQIGPDLRNDPIFETTRETFATLSALADEFTDCEEESVFVPGTATAHVPELKRCERLALPTRDSCTITHDVQVQMTEYSGALSTKPSVDDRWGGYPAALEISVDLVQGNARWAEPYVSSDDQGNFLVEYGGLVTVPIPAVSYSEICAGREHDATAETLTVTKTSGDPTAPGYVWPSVNGYLNGMPAHSISGATVTQQPTCANNLVAKLAISGGECRNIRVRTGGETETWRQCSGEVSFELKIELPKVVVDTWKPDDCVAAASNGSAGICTVSLTTTEGPAPGSCGALGGRTICPGTALYDLISRPPFDPDETGTSRLAERVELTSKCTLPEVVCYEDDAGNTVCPEGEAASAPIADTCEPLRSNPQCSFVSTAIVQDALDDNGNPYIWEDTYDCGYAVSEETVERQVGLLCPSAIRGIGTDFITPPVETNESFAKVAATLEAASMMAMDSECKVDEVTGEMTCDLFGGDALQCKKAVGGVVNCCEAPTGVSLAQYLQLVFAVRELDGAIGHMDPNSPLRGAWETMAGPIDSAWSELSQGFTSAFNSITGSTTAQATDGAAQSLLGVVEQEMLKTVAEWTTQLFGESATNLLFSATAEAGGGAAVDVTTGQMASSLQLGGGGAIIGSALSFVMAAYTIYSVTMLIIQVAWKCKKSEFELAAKVELKSCHYNGTFCAKKVLGFCIERRQSYCCFSSPLSRIMQEQLRPLLGRGWGSAKSPDCGPIDVRDFQSADWSKVDLSEWMGILIGTGMMPEPGSITIDELTGSGRALAAGIKPEVRKGTPERTEDRFDGLTVDDLMDQAKQELLGATSPAR